MSVDFGREKSGLGFRFVPHLPFPVVVLLVPAVVSVLLVTVPIPQGAHPGREIAGYFQTLALLRDGLASYYYFTPDESMAALHLHSILSTPFLAIGWHEGGRLVSLLAMTAAAGFVGLLTKKLTEDSNAAVFGVAAFWMHPWILATATAYTPDAVGIALTTASLYAALRYLDSQSLAWFVGLCVATALAATNHLWELSIVLPVVVVLFWDRQFKQGIFYGGLSTLVSGLVFIGTSLQPSGVSKLAQYSILSSPFVLFDPATWLSRFASPHPVNIDVALSVIVAIGATVVVTWLAVTARDREWILFAAWLGSAVSIPLALPAGYEAHMYYSWAVYAPLAVLSGFVVSRTNLRLPTKKLSIAGVTLAVTYLLVFELALVSGALGSNALTQATTPVVEQQSGLSSQETIQAGTSLEARDVKPGRIVFTGNWTSTETSTEGEVRFGNAVAASQALIYSDGLVKSRRLNVDGAPRFTVHPDCRTNVNRSGDRVVLKSC